MRGRKAVKVWVYQNYEFVKECNTLAEASQITQDSVTAIRMYLNQSIPTKRGYVYTTRPLSDEELMKLPFRNEVVDDENDESDASFYLETTKEKRREQLKQFLYPRLRLYWSQQPKHVAEFERHFLHQILNGLV